jgi:hypothetical protein
MKFPVTQKVLADWAGPRVYHDGKTLFEGGAVKQVEYEHPIVRGSLTFGARTLTSQFELLPDGSAENRCPCRDSQDRGIICSHVVALAMTLVRRQTDPERERKAFEEQRRAARIAGVDESKFIRRVGGDTVGAIPAKLRLVLARGWAATVRSGRVPLLCFVEIEGCRLPLDRVATDLPLLMSRQDDNLMFILEDISEGPARARLDVNAPDFVNLLNILPGKPLYVEDRAEPITVNAVKMSSVLRMDLDRENGELILMVHTELPFMDSPSLPVYVVSGRVGWIYEAGYFWPLEKLLPVPLRAIYEKTVSVERAAVPRFLQTELPLIERHIRVETDVRPDLFTIEPGAPRFRLSVRGSPASLAATLYAEYDGISMVAGKAEAAGQFARPDPDDLLRYTVRNPAAESAAIQRLAEFGLRGDRGDALSDIVGCREVLNFLGRAAPKLRRKGWKLDLTGSVEPFMESLSFAAPVVRVGSAGSAGLFEVGFAYEDGEGQSLSEVDIQRAILKGDSYLEKSGRAILLDSDAIHAARDVFADCASGEGSKPGTFTLDGIYSAYVKSSLDALDGIDVEAAPAWLDRARRQNRGAALEPVPLDPELERILRPYQKDGVYWLRFLENCAFRGILADEMGLGKTLQTLAWLKLDRSLPAARGKPALIVCPTSLVENWAEEAARFVPSLGVLLLSGSDRHEKWDDVANADLVVTSYALLRRDIEQLKQFEFSATILDEAQHIKNRSTQNAVAAKQLKAANRFVLTGTPIENSVADLWSIMDFLMPGYLGGHGHFRQRYELPIAAGGPDGEAAQSKLRRKLHPFLMRRMKKDVARDLPPKIQRVASCSLTRDQQLVYQNLLEASRRRISDMVMKQGFERSRMEILKTLLRLRQTCCHLDLLKLPDLKSEYPSAKMDLFFELLDEALDGGHRALVFSQFTSMLAILRRELERRERAYCYLDGATRDRLNVVREFNTNRSIPVFLISLKAGGAGLNLTGADMVVHFDPWWNPAVEDQATDRAHRIGQSRTVYSVKLITRGTVEEKVLAMQKKKQSVIDATLARDEQAATKLTWEDVKDLLSL